MYIIGSPEVVRVQSVSRPSNEVRVHCNHADGGLFQSQAREKIVWYQALLMPPKVLPYIGLGGPTCGMSKMADADRRQVPA